MKNVNDVLILTQEKLAESKQQLEMVNNVRDSYLKEIEELQTVVNYLENVIAEEKIERKAFISDGVNFYSIGPQENVIPIVESLEEESAEEIIDSEFDDLAESSITPEEKKILEKGLYSVYGNEEFIAIDGIDWRPSKQIIDEIVEFKPEEDNAFFPKYAEIAHTLEWGFPTEKKDKKVVSRVRNNILLHAIISLMKKDMSKLYSPRIIELLLNEEGITIDPPYKAIRAAISSIFCSYPEIFKRLIEPGNREGKWVLRKSKLNLRNIDKEQLKRKVYKGKKHA